MRPEELAALKFSRHARETMAARNVSPARAVEILRRPQVVEPHGGARRYVRDGVVVVVAPGDRNPDDLVVLTVLLRERSNWTSSQMARRVA